MQFTKEELAFIDTELDESSDDLDAIKHALSIYIFQLAAKPGYFEHMDRAELAEQALLAVEIALKLNMTMK